MSASTTAPPLVADRALPHRDRLLDPSWALAAMAETLASGSATRFDRVEQVKVKYRVDESLRVLHRVWSGHRSWLVAARMTPGGRSAALYSRGRRLETPADGPLSLGHHADSGTVFWTFPNDRRLRAGQALDGQAPVVRALFPTTAPSVHIQAYTPERCVTARLDEAGTRRAVAYAKVYADGSGIAAARMLDALGAAAARQGAGLRVPRVLACDEERGLLLVSPVDGRQMTDLAPSMLPVAFSRLGTALGCLHDLPAPGLPPFRRLTLGAIGTAADLIARVRPDTEPALGRLRARLHGLAPRAGRMPAVCLHGDVNSKNWMVDDRSAGLIDFDQASRGPAACDLAGVLAGLRLRTVVGDWTQRFESTLADAFLEGYARVRPLPAPAALAWHTGAALLVERALRAVSRVRRDALIHLPQILDESRAWTERAQ